MFLKVHLSDLSSQGCVGGEFWRFHPKHICKGSAGRKWMYKWSQPLLCIPCFSCHVPERLCNPNSNDLTFYFWNSWLLKLKAGLATSLTIMFSKALWPRQHLGRDWVLGILWSWQKNYKWNGLLRDLCAGGRKEATYAVCLDEFV